MNNMLKIFSAVALAVVFGTGAAQAGNCNVPGRQDSTCTGVISYAYTQAPTCPPSQTQTSAPTWNGSSWVGLGCRVNNPPPPPLAIPKNQTLFSFFGGFLGAGTFKVSSDSNNNLFINLFYFGGSTPYKQYGPYPVSSPVNVNFYAYWLGAYDVLLNLTCGSSPGKYSCTMSGVPHSSTNPNWSSYTPTVVDSNLFVNWWFRNPWWNVNNYKYHSEPGVYNPQSTSATEWINIP
jgi:hypothetical protein